MEFVKKNFDDFEFHARVMPVLVVMMPLIILCILNGIISNDVLDYAVYTIIIIIFLTLSSKFTREMGKEYERKMYQKLGGKPTTIILRYSDNRIDDLTKTRYHKKLNEMVGDLKLPLSINEENENTDVCYESAVNWLRRYSNSNRDAEFRVYQELKEYNFWRNLYGIRTSAITLYILAVIREVLTIKVFNIEELIINPYPNYISLLIMIITIALITVIVNKDTVERKAFDYAKTLIEVCERI